MLSFKLNIKIFIVEFICAVLMETIYSISVYGIGTAGYVSLGFLPTLVMFLIAYKVEKRDIVLRCLYGSAIVTFFFLGNILHAHATLSFMYLVMAIALSLFLNFNIQLEYFIVTQIILIGIGVFRYNDLTDYTDLSMYVTYLMMYAFANVAMLFIIVGVKNYKKDMEEKNELAKEALEAKSNFLANMSHEIRTPMNAIYGMAEILEKKEFSKEEKDYIATIKRSSESLLAIINEILDFSKVDSGKMKILSEPYDFVNMVQDVVAIIEFRLKGKNIKLELQIDPNIPKELIGDENRLKQVLINLLNNAVKFTHRGTITLYMSWHFDADDRGRMLIQVKDTGIGISEENISKLFTAFGQLDTKKNRNVEGTGLGLAICKKIVNLMGGDISVASVLKEGSTFSVSVPQRVYDATPSDYMNNVNNLVHYDDNFRISFIAPKTKVLIVDDNNVNRQVARELLKLYSIEAHEAESGPDAIDKVDQHLMTYDIIFMDHMMPYMDGVEATGHIRSIDSEYAKKVPIVALTANAINGVAKTFLNAGMNDYLPKPIRLEQLDEVLRKWIPDNKKFSVGTTIEEIEKRDSEIDITTLSKEEIAERLDGIDAYVGIKNCAGSIDVYFDLLQTYATSTMASVLNDLFEKEDLENYKVIVHSIKGASKNIGAHGVADKAYALERAAERGDINYIWDNHEELIEEYTAILKLLKNIFFGIK